MQGVYKIKNHCDGTIVWDNACLVAKGYTQTEGPDYTKIFALVAILVTIRCLLSNAVIRLWPLHQLNVNNAFIHVALHEDVYMQLPLCSSRQGKDGRSPK